eukprot:scaffold3418_cov207-Ochromonas_danica.AAC.1
MVGQVCQQIALRKCEFCAICEEEAGLDYAMKLYHFHCAAGFPAPPVFVSGDYMLKKIEYNACEVQGLCRGTSLDGYGHVPTL